MMFSRCVFPSLMAVLLAGCAGPELQPYVGDAVRVGHGGTVTTVHGMPIWRDGAPPRRFRILGVIEEEGGGHATPGTVQGDIVKAALACGADALIVMEAGRSLQGLDLSSGDFVGRPRMKTMAIKYL